MTLQWRRRRPKKRPKRRYHRFSRKVRAWAFRGVVVAVVAALAVAIVSVVRAVTVHVSTGNGGAAASSQISSVAPASSSQTEDPFANAAFIGNSCIDTLDMYGILPESDFFARTGLTLTQAFEKPTISGSVPVLDELKQGTQYDRVFLLFGENELGWSTDSVFVERYGEVIDSVHESQPNATIYVQSIFPVSKEVSEENKNNINNDRINQYNAMLQQLCAEKGVTYVNLHDQFTKEDGSLQDGLSADGIHFNLEGCQKWVDCLRESCTASASSASSGV